MPCTRFITQHVATYVNMLMDVAVHSGPTWLKLSTGGLMTLQVKDLQYLKVIHALGWLYKGNRSGIQQQESIGPKTHCGVPVGDIVNNLSLVSAIYSISTETDV